MLPKKIALLISLLILDISLPAQYDSVFNVPFPRQYQVLDSVMEVLLSKDTLAASHAFKKIETAARKTGNELNWLNTRRAFLGYQITRLTADRDMAGLAATLEKMQQLLVSVDEKKYPDLAAMLNYRLGLSYYYEFATYNTAFSYYKKAYELFKNVSSDRCPGRQYSQYAIARAYYQFNDFETAIKLGKENELINQTKNYISVFNVQMIGLSYLALKNYDSALTCFLWVKNHYQLAQFTEAWKGIALGSIGNVYFLRRQYDKAIPFLDSGILYTAKYGVYDNTAVFASHLSGIYIGRSNLQLARKYADIAYHSVFNGAGQIIEPARHQFLSNILLVYQTFADYYRKAGDMKAAIVYLDSAALLKDSLAKWHDVNLKNRGELAVEEEKANQRQLALNQEQSKNRIIRNALLACILLVMVVTLLAYSHSKLKARHREQQLMNEKQMAEAELKNAAVQLKEFTRSILEKNELIEKINQETARLNEEHRQSENLHLNNNLSPLLVEQTIKRLQEFVLLTDDDWKEFMQLFDKVHTGFFIRLKEKLPALSPAETRFIALSRLKLTNKEMAAMLGVSTDAIRQGRSRLKKSLTCRTIPVLRKLQELFNLLELGRTPQVIVRQHYGARPSAQSRVASSLHRRCFGLFEKYPSDFSIPPSARPKPKRRLPASGTSYVGTGVTARTLNINRMSLMRMNYLIL